MKIHRLQIPLLAALTVSVAGCGGGGSSTTSRLEVGLIHHWKFDGDARDSAGGLSATPIGPVSFVSGVLGQGIAFNGTTTGISLPPAFDMQFQSSFSLSAWAKLDSLPTEAQLWATIIFDGDDRPGVDPYDLQVSPSGDLQFLITSPSSASATDGTMPLHEFVLVTGTYDKATGTQTLYLNGSKVDQKSGQPNLTPVVELAAGEHPGIGIGTNNGFPESSYNMGWNGVIDDLRVYNRALTPSEVAKLYSQGVAP